MLKNRRPAWLTIGTIILTLLLNVFIIKISFYVDNRHVFWMLIVSIPLLTIAIYNAWQTNYLLKKHLPGNMQPSTQQSDSELLSHSIYPNKIAPTDLKVQIGNNQCTQPYSASIFNVDFIEDRYLENTLTHAFFYSLIFHRLYLEIRLAISCTMYSAGIRKRLNVN